MATAPSVCQVEVYTTARRTCENNVQDILKDFYHISHSEVDIVRVSEGHFKIKGSKQVINRIAEGKRPKKWTIAITSDPAPKLPNYKCLENGHVTIDITYSLKALRLQSSLCENFAEQIFDKKISQNCVITIHKVEECKLCKYRINSAGDSLITPLVKVNITGYGLQESSDLTNVIQSGVVRDKIEGQFHKCWIVWIYTYNGSTKEYWKPLGS